MQMVSMRCIGDAVRRAEVDPAWYSLAGRIVHDRRMHPVAPGVDDLEAHARRFYNARLLDLPPLRLAKLLLRPLDGDRGGRYRGNLHVGRAVPGVLLLTESSVRVL